MDRFAELLKFYREKCHDQQKGRGKLTQARLSDLLEEQFELHFTSQTISYWEQGKNQIHKDDRRLLNGLIQIFVQNGGMNSPTEAETFLLAGNYRPLSSDEQQKIFPNKGENRVIMETDAVSPTTATFHGYFVLFISFLGELVFRPSQKIEPFWAKEAQNPVRWHTFLLRLIGLLGEYWGKWIPIFLPWLLCWWLTWQFTFRLLAWPYLNPEDAWQKVVLYVGGAVVVPALIALFTSTKDDPFWQQQNLATSANLRLYTYQASYIGFFLGYNFVLAFALLGYYLGIQTISPIFSGIAAILPITIGYAAARQLPFDIWRATGNLSLQKNAIFFAFTIMPLFLAFFFFEFYTYALHPFWGPVSMVMAIALVRLLNKSKKPYAFVQFCLVCAGITGILTALLTSQLLLAICYPAFCLLMFRDMDKDRKKGVVTAILGTVFFIGLVSLLPLSQFWLIIPTLLIFLGLLWKWDKPALWQLSNYLYLWFITLLIFFLNKKEAFPELGAAILFTALFCQLLIQKSKTEV